MARKNATNFVESLPPNELVENENNGATTMVATEEQPNPNTSSQPQVQKPQNRPTVVGPIQRTTTTVEKSHVIPAVEEPTIPTQPTVNGLVSTPAPQNVARGNMQYVPAQNEHDEPQWPNMFRPYIDPVNRKLIDDIYRFNKYDFYQLSVEQSLPAGAPRFSGEVPQGPYEDIVEYLKSYAVQNGFPDSAYRIGVVLMPSNKLVASHILKFGNAKKLLQSFEAENDPELVEKEKELKKVKLDAQINSELRRNAPPLVPEKDPMATVIAMQKQSSENTNALVAALAPVLAAIVSKPAPAPAPAQNNEMLMMMMKMQQDMNIKMMEMQQANTKILMEATKKQSGGDMDIFKMMELMEKMKNSIREDLSYGQPDDDIDIDPNNIGASLAVHGIKGLISLFKTGGPAIASAIAQVAASVGKNPTELTEADEPAVRKALNIPPAPPQIASTAQQPRSQPRVIQNPVRQQSRPSIMDLPAPKTLEQIVDEVAADEVATSQAAMEETPAASPNVVQMTPALPQTEETKALMKNDLEGEILLSLDTMIADIRSGRIAREVPTWVDEACARWHKDFLNNLCKIEAPVDIMKKVKEVVGVKAWSPVDIALAEVSAGLDGPVHYQFYMTFGVLKEMWAVVNMAAAEQKKEEVKNESK